ncbi:ATP-binding cassette domain-containing protein [Kibdelosporangium phytohabitans]|uniref:ABC transporter n=1 Tax=Kibdelosporangium phytohabitans TaxID=860235 RepID=A0A0N9I225_9PSEU|nr:ATP-binding cassette domain-containing protein [Kibdelosporangium phytohabitans]ALG10075.1 ABC transporter [Kibdelosporangium phytohabitans]MBE1461051.1 ABC-2 type transport system ATP-binding protein [Kibdelosporangium phytohabitans]
MAERLAVVAEGLRKRYGDHYALDGFDLTVAEGTVCGLLGPNGAGKTTAVRILATLLRSDEGRAEVAGLDVRTRYKEVKRRIGLVGQHAAVDEILSGRQNLEMFGRLFHLTTKQARRRADELLDHFGLTDAAARPAKTYSGGMRRRLDIAASMILSPQVLFLDEPTTGLDPRSRSEVWQAVRDMVAAGTSVLLTTQYLDEADQLADRISVINHGTVIAEGTPDQLKSRLGGDRIDVVLHSVADLPHAAGLTGKVTGADAEVDEDNRKVSVQVTDRVTALVDVARALKSAEIDIEDIALRRPTLDEVFLALTDKEAA